MLMVKVYIWRHFIFFLLSTHPMKRLKPIRLSVSKYFLITLPCMWHSAPSPFVPTEEGTPSKLGHTHVYVSLCKKTTKRELHTCFWQKNPMLLSGTIFSFVLFTHLALSWVFTVLDDVCGTDWLKMVSFLICFCKFLLCLWQTDTATEVITIIQSLISCTVCSLKWGNTSRTAAEVLTDVMFVDSSTALWHRGIRHMRLSLYTILLWK